MTETNDPQPVEKGDYFLAELEEGDLVMKPFCRCGNPLAEEYFCEKCGRQCRCMDVVCVDETTFRFVQDHPPFKNIRVFTASK
jgi:hypothetical protein